MNQRTIAGEVESQSSAPTGIQRPGNPDQRRLLSDFNATRGLVVISVQFYLRVIRMLFVLSSIGRQVDAQEDD